MRRAIVTGAGGFIGYHLTHYLKQRDYYVRGVDIKFPEFGPSPADEFLIRDLRFPLPAMDMVEGGFDELYALAADMGGMGFIEGDHDRDIMSNNTRINMNTLEAALYGKLQRYLFTSSACVYPEHLQLTTDTGGLKEADAYPAAPDAEYGWEKLYAERVTTVYGAATPMQTRIARFHNVYGPQGTWTGGREKAPAAICRKVAEAKFAKEGKIDIWGDGDQT
ncbi:unnamed protein product, partial [marine sediment metagenome]